MEFYGNVKKEKTDIMNVHVELLYSHNLLQNEEFALKYIRQVIARITNKKQEEIVNISFPLGLRPLKVNTRLSFDGFEACMASKYSGGQKMGITSLVAFKMDADLEAYIKRIQSYMEKRKMNSSIELDEKYDKINNEKNEKLYNIILKKLEEPIYNKVFSGQLELVKAAKEKFLKLTLEQQCQCLSSLIDVFKTGRSGGCDLTLIGGKKQAAVCTVSSKVSNWKKNYRCVRIIDESASGIFRKESENILEWL